MVVPSSLGSTRFLKVARATHSDGTEVVVKVFAKNDPLLQLDTYKNVLMEIYRKLYTAANVLPFQHFWVSLVTMKPSYHEMLPEFVVIIEWLQ